MPPNISQRISLDGVDEVKKAFADLGPAAEAFFATVEKAAGKATFGHQLSKDIKEVKDSISSVIDDVKDVAENFAKVGGAVVAAATGFFFWAKASAESVDAMGNLATQAGSTIEDISALTGGLSHLGANTDDLSSSFKKMAVRIEEDWQAIKKSARDGADALIKDNISVQDSVIALSRADQAAAAQFKVASQLRLSNLLSVRSAELGVDEARQRLNELETGDKTDPEVLRDQEIEKARIAFSEAKIKRDQAEQKAAQDAADAENKRAEVALAQQKQQLDLAAAQRKAAEDSANDIGNLVVYVNNLARGVTGATVRVNTSADNIVKGIIASVGPSIESLKEFNGGLGDISSAAPKVTDVLFKLADIFHSTNDETLKIAIAAKLLGKGYSEDLIEALSGGSAELKKFIETQKALGLVFSENDKKIAGDFHRSLNTIGTDLKVVGAQLGLVFAPFLTAIVQDITDAVEGNRQKFLEWAGDLKSKAIPIVRDIINLASGKGDLVQSEWIIGWRDTLVGAFNLVRTFLFETLPNGFREVMGILDRVASAINSVFGTKLTGSDVGVAALVLQFSGLNSLILDVIKTIAILIAALTIVLPAAVAALPALLLLAVPAGIAFLGAAIGASIVLWWPEIKAAFNKFADWLVDEFFPSLGPAIAGALDTALQALLGVVDRVINSIKQKWQALKDWLSQVFPVGGPSSNPSSGAASNGTDQLGNAFAGGGHVRGPGTGTSDSILARLSDNEFVHTARAVAYYGTDFMHAVNNLRLPKDMFRGFNMGGLVNALTPAPMLPRFAEGGIVFAPARSSSPSSRGDHFTLVIGNESFHGLSAGDDVLDRLKQRAVKSRLASTGKAQRSVGG
ncbi:MAG: tail tape measure protein core region [Rhizobium sp.]|nr:tail tape measure protein core region [Rhizobium sp.]